jgi:Tol biopolymer transport system component
MKDPDWSQLPDTTPPRICEVLQRCTKREQKQRLQSIGDARITIEEVLSGNPDGTLRLALTQSRGRWQVMLPWAIAGILAVAVGFLLFHLRFGNDQAQQSIRSSILSPPKYEFAEGGTAPISPNGRYLVFTAAPSDGPRQLWIRSVDSLEAKVLPGTEGAYNPFWSPDSQWIAFNAHNKLKKISIAGSSPLEICDSGSLRGGSRGPDGTILFAPDIGVSVHSVSAAGGTPIPVLQLDTSMSETTQRWPQFLPDGRHFLFFSRSPQNATYVGLLGSSERMLVLKNESNAAFAPPGYLLYVRNHTLMVQPFDTKRLELTGTAVAIAEHVPVNGATQLGLFSASENGVLSIQAGAGKVSQPVWVDRSGKVLTEIAQPAVFDNLRVSPNGEKIAVVIRDPLETMTSTWMYDSSGQRKTRLTFGPYTAQEPTWSPDGNRIIYSSTAKGGLHMYSIPTSGIGRAELLIDSDKIDYPTSWSSDGRYLAFTRQSSSGDRNLKVWILPMSGDKKPHQLLDSGYYQDRAVFSPNGKWLAFETNENGQDEVYVTPFPSAKSKFLVSTGSGNDPQWSADGKGLYYQADDGTIMAASLQYEGDSLRVTGIQKLFKTNSPTFDVSPDGKRFLISRSAENQAVAPITLITNWPAALKK